MYNKEEHDCGTCKNDNDVGMNTHHHSNNKNNNNNNNVNNNSDYDEGYDEDIFAKITEYRGKTTKLNNRKGETSK